jgi:cytoskeleton protein RodZ
VTFFQRFRTSFTDNSVDEQARFQPRARMVGELLQERREELGLDLDEIGAMLRIKPTYLAALEQGRTHDLPGPTYAIGFVRAYAEFLGLEASPVLARFKAEAAGVTARPDLALPVPLGERSVPGGALVLVALIVALCGYGIWYYLSTEERSRPERVAAVPAELKPPAPTLVAPPAAPSPPVPATSPTSGDDAPAQPAAPSLFGAAAGSGQAPASPSPPLSPAAPAIAAAGSSPAPAPVVAGPAQTSPAPAGGSVAPTGSLSTGALLTRMPRANMPGAPPAPAPSAQVTPAPLSAAAPTAPAPSAPATTVPPAASVPASPQTQTAAVPPSGPAPAANAAASAGRVAIRATADCWIQVRASDQSIVFSRVLKAGEVYNVPQRAGLSLRTGNAGVLEISVDGKAVPSIGGIGALRRDVALDPAELAAGTAVHG